MRSSFPGRLGNSRAESRLRRHSDARRGCRGTRALARALDDAGVRDDPLSCERRSRHRLRPAGSGTGHRPSRGLPEARRVRCPIRRAGAAVRSCARSIHDDVRCGVGPGACVFSSRGSATPRGASASPACCPSGRGGLLFSLRSLSWRRFGFCRVLPGLRAPERNSRGAAGGVAGPRQAGRSVWRRCAVGKGWRGECCCWRCALAARRRCGR